MYIICFYIKKLNKKEKTMLAVYLHHRQGILSFGSRTVCYKKMSSPMKAKQRKLA